MLNNQQQLAFDKILTLDKNYFLTGYAGTGKSHLVHSIIEECNKLGIEIAVASTTGSSAVDIGGTTYHSLFGVFGQHTDDMAIRPLTRDFSSTQLIIIDEISMMGCDMLDLIDKKLRFNTGLDLPFGGIKLLIVGDEKQLGPIYDQSAQVTLELLDKYGVLEFTSAKVYSTFEKIELNEIMRSKDEKFISLLNRIRDGDIHACREFQRAITEIPDAVYIANSNRYCDEFNARKLAKLTTKLHTISGFSAGEFKLADCTTPYMLEIKVGARIMITKNLEELKNGDMGTIEDITPSIITIFSDRLQISIEISKSTFYKQEYSNHGSFDKNDILTSFERRGVFKAHYDDDGDEIEPTARLYTRVIGKFTQFPLKLAYAMTTWKSQGKTFEKVVFKTTSDLRLSYVGLSRGQSYENTYVI